MSELLASSDAIILCGGRGSRLVPLTNARPKTLMPIGDMTVFDHIVQQLRNEGCRRIIASIGYLGDQIKEHCRTQGMSDMIFSEEHEPLGTGGALKQALRYVTSDRVLVVNGDTLFKTSLSKFAAAHAEKKALVSLFLVSGASEMVGGRVCIDDACRVTGFSPAGRSEYPYVSAGIYMLDRSIAEKMPSSKKFSLEHDVFPKIVAHDVYGFIGSGVWLDIGTHDRYAKARHIIKDL